MSDTPTCEGCKKPLDRIDHVAIERTILDPEIDLYRDLGINDGSADGSEYGIASETQLRCGWCGREIPRDARKYFYERWARLKQYMKEAGITPTRPSEDDPDASESHPTEQPFRDWPLPPPAP